MAEKRWKYSSNYNNNYTIGIYHGEDSGHFIIYVNSEVVLIEFNILQSKTFGFVVDDESLSVIIKKKDSSFEYSLEKTQKPKKQFQINFFDRLKQWIKS